MKIRLSLCLSVLCVLVCAGCANSPRVTRTKGEPGALVALDTCQDATSAVGWTLEFPRAIP